MSRSVLFCSVVIATLLFAGMAPVAAADRPATRAQALQALTQPSADLRRAGVERLGDIGTMADADRLVARLHDEDEQVRLVATISLWQIWSRSGDKAVDALYRRGIEQMETGNCQRPWRRSPRSSAASRLLRRPGTSAPHCST